MRAKMLVGIAVLMLGATVLAANVASLFEFDKMGGVQGPFVGTLHPIRGIPGGGKAWKVGTAKAQLDVTGKLQVVVTGLVLNDPSAGGANGTNPLPTFRAILSCQSINSLGNPSVVNLKTGNFAATTTGNATIEQTFTLRQPCLAPMVFVTTPTLAWIAVSGF